VSKIKGLPDGIEREDAEDVAVPSGTPQANATGPRKGKAGEYQKATYPLRSGVVRRDQ